MAAKKMTKKDVKKVLSNLKKVPAFSDDDLVETIFLADLGAKLLDPSKEKDKTIAEHMRYAKKCAANMLRVAKVIEYNNDLIAKAELEAHTEFQLGTGIPPAKKASKKTAKKVSKKA